MKIYVKGMEVIKLFQGVNCNRCKIDQSCGMGSVKVVKIVEVCGFRE